MELERIIELVEPKNLEPKETLELCVYQFLIYLTQGEIENQAIIGKMTLDKVFKERLKLLNKNESMQFTAKTEEHFFKLLLILVLNCDENARIVNEKGIKKELG